MNLLPLFRRLGVYYLLTVPLLAGLSTFQLETSSGFTITGVLWVFQLLAGLGLLACMLMAGADLRPTFWLIPWTLWGVWIWYSLSWCNHLGFRNIQEASQMTMPVVIAAIASLAVRTREDLDQLLRVFRVVLVLLLAFVVLYVSGVGDAQWMDKRVRANALTSVLIGGVFLAGFSNRTLASLAGWTGCLFFCFITGSRMASLALIAILLFHLRYRSKWHSLAMLGAACLVAIALFQTDTFQKRFFLAGQQASMDAVMRGEISGQGRFEMWPLIYEKALERPIFGAGVGSAYEFVPTVWKDVNYVHNDYLRIFFEWGIVGLLFFAGLMCWQLIELYRQTKRSDGVVQTTFVAVWLGFWALLITCTTDNTIVYNVHYTNLLFLLLGAACGVSFAERTAKEGLSMNSKPGINGLVRGQLRSFRTISTVAD